MRSFRARLMVWTLSLTGLVLLAFGIASDRAFYKIKMSSLDARLNIIAAPRFPPPSHTRFWNRFSEIVKDEGRRLLEAETVVACYSSEADVETVFIGNWPEERTKLVGMLPASSGSLSNEEPESDMQADTLQRLLEARDRANRRGQGPMWDGGGPDREPLLGPKRDISFHSLHLGGTDWRFAVLRMPGYNVAVGAQMDLVMADVIRLRTAYFWGMPAALGILAIGAWFFASRAIRPIRSLTRVASGISASHLSERLDAVGEDREFAELMEVFNGMLERLERSFMQANRFSADAAHELKTPLSILQGQLESSLQSAEDGSPMQQSLASLLDEVQRLKSISRKLLILAQADTGHLPVSLERVDLRELVEDCWEGIGSFCEGIEMEMDLPETCPPVEVDRSLATQIVQNLFTNAVKYNLGSGGRIWARLRCESEGCSLEIENLCEPIPEADREALFDRFTRRDASRNRQSDGTGLGLSLSREFARAHKGELELLPYEAEDRIGFRWRLPRA